MIRHLVERLSRNSAFRRRLPSAFGGRPVYLSGDSALSYLKPDWAKASASQWPKLIQYTSSCVPTESSRIVSAVTLSIVSVSPTANTILTL